MRPSPNLAIIGALILTHGKRHPDGTVTLKLTNHAQAELHPDMEIQISNDDYFDGMVLRLIPPGGRRRVVDGGELRPECIALLTHSPDPSI